jgi:hypothetical protein
MSGIQALAAAAAATQKMSTGMPLFFSVIVTMLITQNLKLTNQIMKEASVWFKEIFNV